jgi:hypothetical protein
VQDDESREVLKHIIERKKKELLWREQVEKVIEEDAANKVGFHTNNWRGWEAYVREGVAEVFLKQHCLTICEDGGGKHGGRKSHFELLEPRSPLAIKKQRCDEKGEIHEFWEETRKSYAEKGSKLLLDGMTCEGYKEKCGREFVEKLDDAICRETAVPVGRNQNAAWWCRHCNYLLCTPCYHKWNNGKVCCRRRLQVQR